MDYLIQRLDNSGPVDTGGKSWVDEGIARDLLVDQEAQAVQQVATGIGHPNAIRRAIKWNAVSEFDTNPGTPTVTARVKEPPA